MQIGSIVSDDLVQLLTLLIALIGIAFWMRWGRGRMGYAATPISFLVHRSIYYVVLILDPHLSNDIVVMWSSAISLHSVITVASAAVIMLTLRRQGRMA